VRSAADVVLRLTRSATARVNATAGRGRSNSTPSVRKEIGLTIASISR
jgi:hypothetical protein